MYFTKESEGNERALNIPKVLELKVGGSQIRAIDYGHYDHTFPLATIFFLSF